MSTGALDGHWCRQLEHPKMKRQVWHISAALTAALASASCSMLCLLGAACGMWHAHHRTHSTSTCCKVAAAMYLAHTASCVLPLETCGQTLERLFGSDPLPHVASMWESAQLQRLCLCGCCQCCGSQIWASSKHHETIPHVGDRPSPSFSPGVLQCLLLCWS